MSTKTGWFRPAGVFEQFMHELYKDHGLVICYVLRVATAREITGDDVKKVFTHLFRWGQ
jgi:hypothetical protein